jgi:predicted permease
VAILGTAATAPAILSLAFDMIVTSSLCIALSRLDGAGAQGVTQAMRQALRGIARNPLPWSIVLGGVASATGLVLPAPVERTLAMLAEAASPAALFTIGAVLARTTLLARERRAAATPARDLLPVIAIKLIAHPLLVYGIARGFMALGLQLAPVTLVTLVLIAALPSASNVSMLAERFGADNGRIARIILWTTVAAFLTFPLAAGWLGRL